MPGRRKSGPKSEEINGFSDLLPEGFTPPPVLGLGKALESVEVEERVEEGTTDLPEQEAINTIAQRIIEELRENENIKPKNWGDVLRGLELVLKFKHELHRKKGEQDLAYQALQEFKEVADAFSKLESE